MRTLQETHCDFSMMREASIHQRDDKTLNFLQKHFYSGNFIALKDGSTALRGNAAVFVEGWYKDIMYNRGFLASNLNANASIEGVTEHIGFKSSMLR